MNIYFSCAITGGRADQQLYQEIVSFLFSKGHQVLTAHLASPEVSSLESSLTPDQVFTRDIRWISECDALIAEVSTPSHGVGYEIAEALHQGKPVLCCYQQGRRVSRILTGNTRPGFVIFDYADKETLFTSLGSFLDQAAES